MLDIHQGAPVGPDQNTLVIPAEMASRIRRLYFEGLNLHSKIYAAAPIVNRVVQCGMEAAHR